MKGSRMRIRKFARPGVILLATVVAIITSVVVANATQTITTPNAAFVSFSLASGASSASITPATNRSVLVMGCCTDVNGAGHVSLLHLPSPGGIGWAGLGACSGTPVAHTGGPTSPAGSQLRWLALSHPTA